MAKRRKPGRPPLGDSARVLTVRVRVTEDERTRWRSAAERRGFESLSEWLRSLAAEDAR